MYDHLYPEAQLNVAPHFYLLYGVEGGGIIKVDFFVFWFYFIICFLRVCALVEVCVGV